MAASQWKLSLVALLIGSCAVAVGGQPVSTGNGAAGAPRDAPSAEAEQLNMLRRELRAYGIEPTPAGLIAGLTHRERPARAAALRMLAVVGDLNSVAPMAKLLDDPERLVRVEAVRAIHAVVSRESQARAHKLYESSEGDADRLDAAVLLCELGDPSHFRQVLQAIRAPKSPFLTAALRCVPKFARYELRQDGEPVDWIGPVSAVLLDRDAPAMARQSAATALARIATPRALEVLERALLGETDRTVRWVIESALREAPGAGRPE